MKSKLLFALTLLAALDASAFAAGAGMNDEIAALGHHWASAYYDTPDARKNDAYAAVIAESDRVARDFPNKAEPMIWQAIVLASAAKAEGGFGALHKAKQARDLLLAAEKIDANALDGSLYSTLGSLYANVPRWPIGFGDKDKAAEYLKKAVAIDPAGIDSNYFYADLLADEGEYADAAAHLKRAIAAPPRPGREDADAGRRREAEALLAKITQKTGGRLASN